VSAAHAIAGEVDRIGCKMRAFVKATVVGGLLFLLPAALVVLILGHAMRLAMHVARPVSHFLGLDQQAGFGGIGAATVLAILVLVIVSFAAGIVARTQIGRKFTRWVENSLLGGLPQYQMFKSMAEGFTRLDASNDVKPVLVNIEDGWQIGYQIEALDGGWVAVFLPQAPNPMSGNVMYLPRERVRLLAITMIQAMTLVRRIGIGSSDALRGVDLNRLPRSQEER
jgi:uncharacterized membrane protein